MVADIAKWLLIFVGPQLFIMYIIYYDVISRQVAYLACKYKIYNIDEKKMQLATKSSWTFHIISEGLTKTPRKSCNNRIIIAELSVIGILFGIGNLLIIINVIIGSEFDGIVVVSSMIVILAVVFGLLLLRDISNNVIILGQK